MSIASSDNKATFPYGVITNAINVSGTSSFAGLNCTSINNTGSLSTGVLEISSASSPSYIDMKTTGNNLDFDTRIATSGGSVGTPGQGTLTITSASTIINSPLTANSGTFSGITNNTNALTNNSTLTQVGLANFSNSIKVNIGGSVFVTDAGISNYLRMHHSGSASFVDFTGGLIFRNNGATTPLSISSSTNQGTFGYNLNTTGITNSTNALINNGVFTQNNTSTFSSAITAPSISSSGTFYAGSGGNYDSTAISAPKITNGIASGTGDGATYTNFNLGINSWQGVGFVYSNGAAPSVSKLVIDNRSGNLSTFGDIACNSVIALKTPNINLNYTALPTFTSSMVGYQNTFYVPLTNITSGINYSLNSFTLPLGVWNIEVKLIFYASALNVTITQYSVTLFSSLNIIYEFINNSTPITSATSSTYNTSTIYQNPYDVTVSLLYTQQSYTGSGLQILGNGSDKSFVKITRIA